MMTNWLLCLWLGHPGGVRVEFHDRILGWVGLGLPFGYLSGGYVHGWTGAECIRCRADYRP
jgi:hypothetical protein